MGLHSLFKLIKTEGLHWVTLLALVAYLGVIGCSLGGVWPISLYQTLPVVALIVVTHALAMVLQPLPGPTGFSIGPLLFLPALIWFFYRSEHSEMAWLGWDKGVIYSIALILALVVSQMLSSRRFAAVLLSVFILIAIASASFGCYQIFNLRAGLFDSLLPYPVVRVAEVWRQPTGFFAHVDSYLACLLIALPVTYIGAFVRRLPGILRFLSFYLFTLLLLSLALSLSAWALAVTLLILCIAPFFTFERLKRKLSAALWGAFLFCSLVGGIYALFMQSESTVRTVDLAKAEAFDQRVSLEMSAIRLKNASLLGVGAGRFDAAIWSDSVASPELLKKTTGSDYARLATALGWLGLIITLLPVGVLLLFTLLAIWGLPYEVQRSSGDGHAMPARRFYLLHASGVLATACVVASFVSVFSIPYLLFSVAVFVGIACSQMSLLGGKLSRHISFRLVYAVLLIAVAVLGWAPAKRVLQARNLQLSSEALLDQLAAPAMDVSQKAAIAERIIEQSDHILGLNDENADAFLLKSSALTYFYQIQPEAFTQHSVDSIHFAQQALEIAPTYWRAHMNLGIAYAYSGNFDQAEKQLREALVYAPQSSEAHYYYASLLASQRSRQDEAISSARKAAALDPSNEAAKRLEQKLKIL